MTKPSFTSGNDIQSAINKKMKSYYHVEADGKYSPLVCFTCDRFCGNKWSTISAHALKKLATRLTVEDPSVTNELRACYSYNGAGKEPWMKEMFLSQRGISRKCGTRPGFIVCNECHGSLKNEKVPPVAICNGFYFGSPPTELTELWQSELAVLTPSSCFGFCFTYVGGENRKLKGTLGYYKVKVKSIARVVAVSSNLADILHREVVFILNGKMTKAQRKKALEKSKVRPAKLINAIKWLQRNNTEWKDINIDDMNESVKNCDPLVFDCSDEVDEENPSRENEESFSVYFPDGSMSEVYGGSTSKLNFTKVVTEAQNKGFEGQIVSSMSRDYVRDYLGNTFVSSCMLQMPFGRGGCDEQRRGNDGKRSSTWGLDEYAEHLSMISQAHFHSPLFVLKLFNIKVRSTILKSATQQMYTRMSVCNIREKVNSDDFQRAATAHASGKKEGSVAAQQMVKSIDSISKKIPHSNGAVKKARMSMECLQQQKGLGGVFLTVTPDDENSFLISCYSQTDKKGEAIDINNMTREEIKEEARKRKEVRLEFPGISGLNMQYVLDVVIEIVIGWDMEKGCPTGVPGLFGTPTAFGGAVEEQGRTSLHAHFIIWLEGWDTYLENVTSKRERVRIMSRKIVSDVVDNSLTTRLIKLNVKHNNRAAVKAFAHRCTEPAEKKRKRPSVVGEQQLRNLRHRDCKTGSLTFAKCSHCDKEWTNEDLVLDYLVNAKKLKISHFPDTSSYLEQLCYECTKPGQTGARDKTAIHAKYNSHRSSHCTSCFKKRKKDGPATPFSNECRMRLPAPQKTLTVVEKVALTEDGDNKIPWYTWHGEKTVKEIIQVTPKRSEYDLFQNTSCWPVTESIIGGNSNGRVITPGPIGMYTVKYPTKNTQEDDAAPYEPVIQSLAAAMGKEPVHQTVRSDSLSLMARAAFVHNKDNVVGAPMAALLTRMNSRFVFSHEFAYVPVLDLRAVLQTGTIDRTYVRSHKGHRYATSLALDYLCRPARLKHYTPYDFFTTFESVKAEGLRNKKKEVIDFVPNPYYEHPSHVTLKSGKLAMLQVLRQRNRRQLPWVLQFKFPDTASFNGNILTCDEEDICAEMETYAQLVLCLCHSYYCQNDLLIDGSYVLRLREVHILGKLDPYLKFLQNLQDSRANYGRVTANTDELQLCTVAFKPDKTNDTDDNPEEDKTKSDLQGFDLDAFMDKIDGLVESENNSHNLGLGVRTEDFVPPSLDCTVMREIGKDDCGYKNLCAIPRRLMSHDNIEGGFVKHFPLSNAASTNQNTADGNTLKERKTFNQAELVEVLFSKTGFATRTMKFGEDHVDRTVPEANGSAGSIINWGKAAGLDKDQQRAFEVFASSFVLTFYNEARQPMGGNAPAAPTTRNRAFLKAKLQLLKLAGRIPTNFTRLPANSKTNLRAFLHGPAGSGKSAITNVLLMYAQDFCDFVGEIFTSETIVFTAITGVAATLINGQTTCKALGLNTRMENICPEMVQKWSCTRLCIVDEISFATRDQVEKIERNLRVLKDNANTPYGGVDIIFCGDFRQLLPVQANGVPIFKEVFHQFHVMLNCYLELHGMHRFKNDMEWGRMLTRWRNGELTTSDIDVINGRVIRNDSDIPADVRYATYTNRDRAAINVGLFDEYCAARLQESGEDCPIIDDAVVIFASNLKVQRGSKSYVPTRDNAWDAWFFENCSEGDTEGVAFNGRFDPSLMLYYNRPVMVTANVDVPNGIANGTRAYVVQVHLKSGVNATYMEMNGVRVKALRACQVERITLRHERNGQDDQSYFDLTAADSNFRAAFPVPQNLQTTGRRGGKKKEKVRMTGSQFQIIVNNATTGHKLQGAGVGSLFVHAFCDVKNWNYVVLSRVKEMDGLFLRTKLEKKKISTYNEIPDELTHMIRSFREQKMEHVLTETEYNNILGSTET